MQKPNYKLEQGYYLLECVMALTILCITLGASVLRAPLSDMIRLYQAKNQIGHDLNNTAKISRRYQATFGIEFRSGSSVYRVLKYLNEQRPTTVQIRNLPQGVSVDTIRLGAVGNQQAIKFYPNGLASPAALFIKTKSKACKISLSLRGSARAECA
jgi:hypothetical protein